MNYPILCHEEKNRCADFCDGCHSLSKSMFNGLSGTERLNLGVRAIVLHFKKGQTVFLEGRPAQGIFCIKSGVVKLSLDTVLGESITVKLFSNSGMFGYHSVAHSKTLYTAVCLTECELCFFSKQDIEGYMSMYQNIMREINRITIEQEIKPLNDLIVSLRSKSILQRLAETLINIQATIGTDAQGYINLEFTKQELSNMVGSTTESVFRALSSIKGKKYVSQDGRRLKILDEQRLKKLAKAY